MRVFWIVGLALVLGAALVFVWRSGAEAPGMAEAEPVAGGGAAHAAPRGSAALAEGDLAPRAVREASPAETSDPSAVAPAGDAESGAIAAEPLLGLVLDAGGAPVAGAEVTLVGRTEPGNRETFRSRATSGEDGSFAVAAPDPGGGRSYRRGAVELEARAAGFAPQTVRTYAPYPRPVVIRVDRALELVGRVRAEATGAPFPSARLRLLRTEITAIPIALSDADANGAFRFAEVHEGGTYRLEVEVVGKPTHAHSLGIARPEAGTRVMRADVLVPAGEDVPFLVVDAETQAPVAGATLSFSGRVVAHGDAVGRLLLTGSTQDPLVADAAAPGYRGARFTLRSKDVRERPVVLPLLRACRLEGRIVDEGGAPVEGIHVRGYRPGERPHERLPEHVFWRYVPLELPAVRSGSDGRFVLDGVLPGAEPFVLRASIDDAPHRIGRILGSVVVERPGTVVQRDFVLEGSVPTGSLFVRVRVDGEAAPGRIVVTDASGVSSASAESTQEVQLETPLPAGAYRVDVEARELRGTQDVVVHADEVTQCFLALESRPLVVTIGRVVDENERPVPGLQVSVSQESSTDTAFSDGRGEFDFAHRDPKAAVEIVYEDAWQRVAVSVPPGSRDALLRVRRLHDLKFFRKEPPPFASGEVEWRSAMTKGEWKKASRYHLADCVAPLGVPAGPLDLRFKEKDTGRVATVLGLRPESTFAAVELRFEEP